MALRELTVGIDFDVNDGALSDIDDAMNSFRDSTVDAGGTVEEMTGNVADVSSAADDVNTTEEAMDGVGEAADQAGESSEGMGDSIENASERGTKSLGDLAKGVGVVGAAIGGAATAVVGGGVAMANQFADTADEIDKASIRTGVHTDALQELRFAMGQVGVDQSQMDRGLERLTQRIGQAQQGNEKYTEALGRLGMTQAELANMSTDEVFMKSIDQLHEMEDATAQAELAGELFGTRLGRQLLPAIQQGGDAIEDLREEAHELGAVIDEDAINAGVLWADTMDKVQNALGGVWNRLAAELLPGFQTFLDFILDNMPAIESGISTAFGFIRTAMGYVVDAIQWVIGYFEQFDASSSGAFDTVVNAIQTVIEWFQGLDISISDYLDAVINRVLDFRDSFMNLITGVGDFLIFVWENYGETLVSTLQSAWDLIINATQLAWDLILDIFNVIGALLSGNWSELWNSLVDLAVNLFVNLGPLLLSAWDLILNLLELGFNLLIDIVSLVMTGIWNLIQTIWGFIVDFISTAVGQIIDFVTTGFNDIVDTVREKMNDAWDTITEIWGNVMSFFEDLPGEMIELGRDIIGGLIDGITEKAGDLLDAAGNIAGDLWGSFTSFFDTSSPSKLMMGLGDDIGAGLQIGMDDSAMKVAKTAENLAHRGNPAEYYTPHNAPVASSGVASASTTQPQFNIENHFDRDTTPEQAERIGAASVRGAYREWKKHMNKFQREEAIREV
ncbi:hypothetical protein SAMN05192534_12372 [Alteribacillus persepolensis]|uniref:Phage-related protein n=1 Tax=Alteribacillus persepolensis TaxID=568899 RepID=A0A1G8IAV1_9BACI|nr:hypothetical protein [Alteribacillus persepolensis]SDI16119.1 hypothetical protein SAMN05192534_12372 [Alteribacillus persepolensis]